MIKQNIKGLKRMWIDEVLKLDYEYLGNLHDIRKKMRGDGDSDQGALKLVLFGGGATSDFIFNVFKEQYGIIPSFFCDNNIEKQGTIICGIPVISFDELCRMRGKVLIYITTQLYYSIIHKQLTDASFSEEHILGYDMIPQFSWETDYKEFINSHRGEIEAIYDALADDGSKKVLHNRLSFLITRRRDFAVSARSIGNGKQYFDDTVVDIGKIDTLVDLGAYIGDSARQFMDVRNGNFKRVYEFEPDDEYYRIILESFRNDKRVVCIKKGTSDRNCTINVQSSLGTMSSIYNGLFVTEGKVGDKNYEICRLDDELKNRKEQIDMLKMDIEGAELETLKGAAEIIRNDKPLIAVCVYHKSDDLITIPEFIRSINPEYRFYIRHYSDNQTETVMYAVSG